MTDLIPMSTLGGVALGALGVALVLGARRLLTRRGEAAGAAAHAGRVSDARLRALVDSSSDAIFLLGADGVIHYANAAATGLVGCEPGSMIGLELASLAHRDDAPLVASFLASAARHRGAAARGEWRMQRPDGGIAFVEAIARNRLDDAAVRGIVVNARDVSERRALLDQLAHQAFHDPLTGLANRALFNDRVRHALDLAGRQGRTVTLLFLDLDDFKHVNDTMGHAEGDRLLRLVADRLRACARSTDTVARLGGDEFAVLVEDITTPRTAERLIERIREQMSFPFTLDAGEVRVSTSIGSASAGGGDVEEVLRHADIAMYAAKRLEKGGHRAYEAGMV